MNRRRRIVMREVGSSKRSESTSERVSGENKSRTAVLRTKGLDGIVDRCTDTGVAGERERERERERGGGRGWREREREND